MKIWIGILDTRHFEFIATGGTKNTCKGAMQWAWHRHCVNCDMENNWNEFEDGVRYYETEIGQVLKNGDVI